MTAWPEDDFDAPIPKTLVKWNPHEVYNVTNHGYHDKVGAPGTKPVAGDHHTDPAAIAWGPWRCSRCGEGANQLRRPRGSDGIEYLEGCVAP